jgi:DNA-binding GntR family transcriptional regulator
VSDTPFFRTQMGHRFFEHTMPELVRQITRLNDLLERVLVERAATNATPTQEAHGKVRP